MTVVKLKKKMIAQLLVNVENIQLLNEKRILFLESKSLFLKKNSNLASIHENLVLKPLFDLCKSFICDDLIELILEQTLLYNRRVKNISFDLTAGELLRFLGIILLSGYHSVLS